MVAFPPGVSPSRLTLMFVLAAATSCGDDARPRPSKPLDAMQGCADSGDCAEGEVCVEAACQPRICTPEEASCSMAGNGIVTCSDDGLAFELKACRSGQHCMIRDGMAVCALTSCEPGAWVCSSDGRAAELCAKDGSGVEEQRTCDVDEVCVEGSCILADAAPETCEPGSFACDGNVVTECQDDAQTFLPTETDCAAEGKACFEGGCHEVVCAKDFECRPDGSYECLDNGTRWALTDKCGADTLTFCSTATGRCKPYVCYPGTAVCDENTATRCRDDGSGPLPDGIACSEVQGCWDGACLPRVCTEPFVCSGRELASCEKGGTELTPQRTCGPGTECNAELGDCTPVSCDPDAPVCLGAVATRCNDDGVGYASGGSDCAESGQGCLEGTCVPRVCEPLATFCSDSELRHCDESAAGFTVLDTCLESETCDSVQAACVINECEPETPLCVGNVLTACNASGTGPAAGGTDCSEQGSVCDGGVCVPKACEPGLSFCQNGHVFLCNAAGSNAAPFEICEVEAPCSLVSGSAECGTVP